jgi:hypothetical protein
MIPSLSCNYSARKYLIFSYGRAVILPESQVIIYTYITPLELRESRWRAALPDRILPLSFSRWSLMAIAKLRVDQ